VSSEDCLHRTVTRVDIVNCKAGGPSELDGHVGLVCEGARSAGPPHECDWRIGMVLTPEATMRSDRQVRTLLGRGSWP
jgi:hypothetical protein